MRTDPSWAIRTIFPRHRRAPVLFILWSVVAGLYTPTPLAAQPYRHTLHLRLVDRDLDIPLEGVQVREVDSGAYGVTDENGELTLPVTLTAPRAVLDLFLFGYEPIRTMITEFDTAIELEMVLEGILLAEELVIVANRIGRSDDQAGVSIVVDREFIKSSAMIGVIEDVMSTVKLLPGVSYAGAFGAFLSVRGGEPDGLTHVLDGLVVKYPYHWGGGVSVFNPHVVDTVKLSAGIFPVRYGQATSGLMEVTSRDPVNGLRWEVAQSTSTFEGYTQVPVGDHSGLFAGTRLTNYDLVFAMTGQFLEEQGVTFSRIPYIYAGYLRWFSRPSPRTEWFVNGFFGTDGIGLRGLEPDVDETQAILNTFNFTWANYNAMGGLGVQRLVGDRLQLRGLAGYEYVRNEVDAALTERGTRTYSEGFVDEVQSDPDFVQYRPYVSAGDGFSIDQPNGFLNANVLHHTQVRLDATYQVRDSTTMELGAGGFLPVNDYDTDLSFWVTEIDEQTGAVTNRLRTIDQSARSNRTLTTFAYAAVQADLVPELFSTDVGVRVDHAVLYGEGFSLNTVPALGPRALVRWTPAVDGVMEETTATVGAGIFTKVPFDAGLINDELETDALQAPKSLMALAGWEARFIHGVRFKIEGYYKHLYDRFYINFNDETRPDGSVDSIPTVYSDGTGHVAGFDLVLDRRTSPRIDGMLAYSFIVARYRNPTGDADDGGPSEPRGRWYYPSFHRFHTLNLLLNVKPRDWMTLTTTVTFSTGTLAPAFGEKETVPSFIGDARDGYQAFPGAPVGLNVAETYEREEFYDDDNREGWVMPVDVRLSFHNYPRDGKVYREFYVGAEDVLSPLLSRIAPTSDAVTTDRYTGEDTREAEQEASFPIISIGFRLSY